MPGFNLIPALKTLSLKTVTFCVRDSTFEYVIDSFIQLKMVNTKRIKNATILLAISFQN
jgi:hypothetical protein